MAEAEKSEINPKEQVHDSMNPSMAEAEKSEINQKEQVHDSMNPSMAEAEKSEINLKGSSDPKENTRSTIAKIYVYAFFSVIFAVLIVGFFKEFKVDEFKDMLVTISGVLSGPLGFIVGYYFKASKE